MSHKPYLTASDLYNYIQCPHRVWRDIYGPQQEKLKETNPFVEMLWEKGVQHEKEALGRMGQLVDLGHGDQLERIQATKKAMADGAELLYQPIIIYDNLLGIPDFLKKLEDGTYIAIDVKSGRGFEGTDEEVSENGPKLKKHYAVQLALYTEILENTGYSNGHRQAIVHDIEHKDVIYELNQFMGVRDQRSYWQYYQWLKVEVWNLITNKKSNDPAMAGICKLCPWYNSCSSWVKANDDTTGLFYVGRSVRDTLRTDIGLTTIRDAQKIDVDSLMVEKDKDKQFLQRIGQKTLEKIKVRAEIMANKLPPVLYDELDLPDVEYELFFDIEDDPTQAFVYLHGVYERTSHGEKFIPFVASSVTLEAEAQAWLEFWSYIRSLPQDNFALYYYSHHEETTYKKMADLYPHVANREDVEWLFDDSRAIDLYRLISKSTDWPVGSYSLKSIAKHLGFSWRDKTPSGALSIQWYNDYLKTADKSILERILLYNEDDCIATMVIKDALMKMKPTNPRVDHTSALTNFDL